LIQLWLGAASIQYLQYDIKLVLLRIVVRLAGLAFQHFNHCFHKTVWVTKTISTETFGKIKTVMHVNQSTSTNSIIISPINRLFVLFQVHCRWRMVDVQTASGNEW